ncbi:MAG: hypothetical protein ACRC6M_10355 [Microcystaceae cyanobacterium]
MKHFCDDWIQEWCEDNGWTELFQERYNHYWAFPPNAVMPEPIPFKTLRFIKSQKGFCQEEKYWLRWALGASVLGIIFTIVWKSPMPLVLAFGFGAITVAQMEVEEF